MNGALAQAAPIAPATDGFSGTSRRHTSEPRWSQERPSIDETTRLVLVVAGDDPIAAESAALWAREAGRAGAQVKQVNAAGNLLATATQAAVECAPISARLHVAGDEAVIGRAVAGALAGGLRMHEIAVQLTAPAGPRLVQCVHCRALTATTAPVDGECACAGCGVPLLVFPHYSRRLGAYLGFRIDAEELP